MPEIRWWVGRSPTHHRISGPFLLALALTLLAAGAAPPAQAQSAGPEYIVQAGDTLYDIARRFGVTLEALQAANPGIEPAALAVGQALVIPGYPELRGRLATHDLEPGETLDSLARRWGLRRETLIRLNRVLNPEHLYINQPVVVVDQPDNGPPLAAGQAHALPASSGLLAFSAAQGQNPWALAALNRLAHPGLAPGGSLLWVPGGDQPPRALPFPLMALSLRPFPLAQGGTLSLQLSASQPVTVRGSLGPWPLGFVTGQAGLYHALQGIERLAEPDLYPLVLETETSDGQVRRLAQWVPVRAADYGVDPPLRVDPATLDPAATGPENEQVREIVAPVTPERLWQGIFALPSVGAIRSRFGALRSYNGGPYDAFHTGTDFSGAEDRPITAPAPGVVVFAGPLTVRGNATLIDHGWGVYTGYWHQSAIVVAVGERVDTGQVIGYQGATGRATGPHLHWEVWVHGAQVNPLRWTEEVFP